jgi:hypothetical protein
LVEPKCGSSYNTCKGESSSQDCSVNCETSTTFSSQGVYQNVCTKIVENITQIPIASLSNVRNNECIPVKSIKLNTICLTWCDFVRLFYPNNSFRISLNNAAPCATFFSGQTYEDTSNPCIRFYLSQLVRSAWEGRCNAPFANVPLKTGILLEKDTSTIRSLYSATSFIALTLDEVIDTLITNGQITPADSTSRATVIFTIEYIYYFQPLDIAVQVNFNYKTAIPCYKNVEQCDNWCPVYPNCGNCDLSESSIPKVNEKHFDLSDNDSSIGGDNHSQTDLDTFNDEMKELMNNKQDDNRSFVSFEESKW